ncbi:MAG: hypothetical protein KDA93_24745 [Planctomycetaceae bacterium]|nr:hypothetical protein [Planctomycetaceae bacterium]
MNSPRFVVPHTLSRKLITATISGAVILGVTTAISPDRAWANLLLLSYFLITLGLGGALFIALTNVCGASWHVAFRRVPEAMTGLLPIAGILLLATLAIRLPQYGWHHHGHGGPGTFWFKELWLSPKFFAIRAVTFVLLWVVLARILVGSSRRQDAHAGKPIHAGVSVLFLGIFAITISLAGVDWIMALEPLWFSTMWGVYQFSGLILATLAAMIIGCICLRRMGPLEGIFTDEHLHDLGKLLIGFSCFWMYIWFSQYMLIWYSNIPEETSYFIPRLHGPWAPIVAGSLVLNWIIPFFVLLPRPSKRSESIMLRACVVVLIGRWVDLYMMIFPPVIGTMPTFGLPEVASMVIPCGLASWLFFRSFARAAPVPAGDPDLVASLHYHA